MSELLSMRNITKRYGNGVLANEDVSFSLREGEIHAIAGENGAGKSTLMKILFGAEQPTSGVIELRGQPVKLSSPKAATNLGIGMVYQHFMLVNELPVYLNVFLGVEKRKGLLLDKQAMIDETRALCEKYDMPVDPLALCGDLPVGLRQKVEILKVLARGAKIIILDEPTAVLTPQETEQLFKQLRILRDANHTIVIITHKLKEMKELCDRITIMRQGKTMGVVNVCDVTEQQISELMVGGAVRLKVDKADVQPGEVVAEMKAVTVPGAGKPKLDQVSLTARAGEILCLAGVEGNGQQQAVECLTGQIAYQGSVTVLGEEVRGKSIRKIRDLGMAHIPEDRMTMGTDQRASLHENLISVDFDRNTKLGFLKDKALKTRSEQQLKDFLVKGERQTPISMLSGGNMQKVVVARELTKGAKLIIANQPTRGVDVGAIAFIHEKLVELRDQGCGIVLVSADMSEVFSLADRIIVFHDGHIAAEITDVANCTEQQLGRYMLGIDKMERTEAKQ
nr:ABC transporter ATP-binding protein [Clostridia bacterium]